MAASQFSVVRLARRGLLPGAGLIVLAGFPVVVAALGDGFLVSLASRILIFALAASSLNLALGYGGMVSLGHAAFVGLGAYAAGLLSFHYFDGTLFLGFIPGTNEALIAWIAAAAVAGLFAAATGALALRTSGVNFIMITLAFGQMFYFFFVALKTYGGDDGLTLRRAGQLFGVSLRDDVTLYYICLALLVAYLFAAARLVHSRFGLVVRGIRENERRMAHLGFPVFRYKLVCYTLAGAVAGVAGALLAEHERFVSPDMMNWTRSSELLIMVVLGGMGTRFGPLLGAIALIGLESLLSAFTENWMFILGPLLVVVILFANRGISGALFGREG